MKTTPRVAFCTDTFDEINGVATISQQFAAYAQRRGSPFLIVRPGRKRCVFTEGSVTTVQIARSPLCVPLDMGLRFDLLVARHHNWLCEQLKEFQPDVMHVTGPGDIGMLCAYVSFWVRAPKIPLVA